MKTWLPFFAAVVVLTSCSSVDERQQRILDSLESSSGSLNNALESVETTVEIGKEAVQSAQSLTADLQGRFQKVLKGIELIREGVFSVSSEGNNS